jgi:tight adherence protein C
MNQWGPAVLWGAAAAVLVGRMPSLSTRWKGVRVAPAIRSRMIDAVGHVRGTTEGIRSVLRDQLVSSTITLVAVTILLVWNFSMLNLVFGVLLVAAAWQVPLIVARAREKKRREEFDLELSDALGEMIMGVEAGLTLESVMSLYSQRRRTSLATEFSYVLDRINLGDTRLAALERLRERTPTPGVSAFVSAVQQHQKLGTPLATVLRRQRDSASRRRRQAVEEYAAKLSLKMVFPTVLCILPVLMIVVVGPAIIRLVQTLGG